MLYKFKSKASGDVIMTEPIGNRLLGILGREPAPKGIFEVADLPALIAALEAAISADEASRAAAGGDEDDPRAGDRISLKQRAWPLLDMMKRALAGRVVIVWGV
ncbi:MAG: DUF1840 domain-containing protein [Ideonella sp.]|jgi:hypothetical protein|nr:DUF1840 domain-containing protein [Ideonella sp.]